MPVTRAQVDALIAKLEPQLRRAFEDAIRDWRANIDLSALSDALKRGDLSAATQIANLQPGAMSGFLRAYELAFDQAGSLELAALKLNILFNVRHLSGEQQLRKYGADLIRGISDDGRAMVRTVLTDGLARGQGALATARQVREYIGINDLQAQWAINLRTKLQSDPKALLAEINAGGYKLRDKRLDGIIRRSVADGKPIADADVEKIVVTYKNRSLRSRAESIARTETLSAVNAGKHESYLQAVDSGKVAASAVRKVWNTRLDGRERQTHAAMNGESVGIYESFVSPSGARLLHPGDKTAPAAEVINCRCNATYRIDRLANVR
jgi:hypothetical protein